MRVRAGLSAALLFLALTVQVADAAVGDIVVGGVLVLRIREGAGGISAEQRAVIVRQRITEALSRLRGPIVPDNIVIRFVGGQPVIFIGDVMIITVDTNHARLNATTPRALAEVWAQNLRQGLPKAVPQPIIPPP